MGNCPVKTCNQMTALTTHHILPKRFFGKTPFVVRLCQRCHTELERKIPNKQQLTPHQYFAIAHNFVMATKKTIF